MTRSKERIKFKTGQSVYVRGWPYYEVGRILGVKTVDGWPAYEVLDKDGTVWHLAQLFLSTKNLNRFI
jgi:hypothetical protein